MIWENSTVTVTVSKGISTACCKSGSRQIRQNIVAEKQKNCGTKNAKNCNNTHVRCMDEKKYRQIG